MNTNAPLDRSGGGRYAIPDLVEFAAEGSIRVPTFQRRFIWDAKDVRDLFDSLYRGFPVGTLLLWRHRAPAGKVTLGPITIEVQENPNALWVVDGQQRITSLFAALSPDHRGIDERFEVYFDLATEKFVNPRRGVVLPRSIPVWEALETRSLLNWLRRHGDELESEDFDLADRLGGALRDYKIPAYIVSGNDQALLREVFDRVNSAGKPISRAQVFHALFANEEEPGSPASVVQALRSLNFGDLDENRIVQSVLAVRGGDVQRDMHDEFGSNEDPANWYDRTEQALVKGIGFLRSEGVEHLLMLPNTLPIPVLAAFFHLHPNPDPWILRLLARWLWRGWVHGFGREGGQTPTLRRAIRSVNPEHRNPERAPSEFDAVKTLLDFTPDRDTPHLSLENFKTNFANSGLILLAMASLGPRKADNSPVNLAAELQAHGADAVTEFLRGHRTHAAARGFWPANEKIRPAEVKDDEILESHAIDGEAAHSLRSGDVEDFLRRRGDRIKQVAYNYLDSRLEPEALVRPPLDDLALAGAAEDDL